MNDDDIRIELQAPDNPVDHWLVDVSGYAGTSATIGTGEDAEMALETALVNLEQLRAHLVIKLLEVRVGAAVQQQHVVRLMASGKGPREYPGDPTDRA